MKIGFTHTNYKDRDNYDARLGSTCIPLKFMQTKKAMWWFRIWKGGSIQWHSKTTLGIALLGNGFYVGFPFKF